MRYRKRAAWCGSCGAAVPLWELVEALLADRDRREIEGQVVVLVREVGPEGCPCPPMRILMERTERG